MQTGIYGTNCRGTGQDKYVREFNGADVVSVNSSSAVDKYCTSLCNKGFVYLNVNGVKRVYYRLSLDTNVYDYDLGVHYGADEKDSPFAKHWAIDYADCKPTWLFDDISEGEVEQKLPHPEQYWLKLDKKPVMSVDLGDDSKIVAIVVDKLLSRKKGGNQLPICLIGDNIDDCKRIMTKALKCLPRKLANEYSFSLSVGEYVAESIQGNVYELDVCCMSGKKEIDYTDPIHIADIGKNVGYEFSNDFADFIGSLSSYQPISDAELAGIDSSEEIIDYLNRNVIKLACRQAVKYDDHYLQHLTELRIRNYDAKVENINKIDDEVRIAFTKIAYELWFKHFDKISLDIIKEYNVFLNPKDNQSAMNLGNCGVVVSAENIAKIVKCLMDNDSNPNLDKGQMYEKCLWDIWLGISTDVNLKVCKDPTDEFLVSHYELYLEFCHKFSVVKSLDDMVEYFKKINEKKPLNEEKPLKANACDCLVNVVKGAGLEDKISFIKDVKDAPVLLGESIRELWSEQDFNSYKNFMLFKDIVKLDKLKDLISSKYRNYISLQSNLLDKLKDAEQVAKELNIQIEDLDNYKSAKKQERENYENEQKEIKREKRKSHCAEVNKKICQSREELFNSLPMSGKKTKRKNAKEKFEAWTNDELKRRHYGAKVKDNTLGEENVMKASIVLSTVLLFILGAAACFITAYVEYIRDYVAFQLREVLFGEVLYWTASLVVWLVRIGFFTRNKSNKKHNELLKPLWQSWSMHTAITVLVWVALMLALSWILFVF